MGWGLAGRQNDATEATAAFKGIRPGSRPCPHRSCYCVCLCVSGCPRRSPLMEPTQRPHKQQAISGISRPCIPRPVALRTLFWSTSWKPCLRGLDFTLMTSPRPPPPRQYPSPSPPPPPQSLHSKSDRRCDRCSCTPHHDRCIQVPRSPQAPKGGFGLAWLCPLHVVVHIIHRMSATR